MISLKFFSLLFPGIYCSFPIFSPPIQTTAKAFLFCGPRDWVVTAVMRVNALLLNFSQIRFFLKTFMWQARGVEWKQDKRVASITKKGPWALPPPSSAPAFGQGHIGEPPGRAENRIAEITHVSGSRNAYKNSPGPGCGSSCWGEMVPWVFKLRESPTSFLGPQSGIGKPLRSFPVRPTLAGAEVIDKGASELGQRVTWDQRPDQMDSSVDGAERCQWLGPEGNQPCKQMPALIEADQEPEPTTPRLPKYFDATQNLVVTPGRRWEPSLAEFILNWQKQCFRCQAEYIWEQNWGKDTLHTPTGLRKCTHHQ